MDVRHLAPQKFCKTAAQSRWAMGLGDSDVELRSISTTLCFDVGQGAADGCPCPWSWDGNITSNPTLLRPPTFTKHNTQTPLPATMKFSLAVAASMATASMATPIFGHWGQKWGNNKQEVAAKGPFEFTSTYELKAVPEEVVDADNKFTGGLKGASGLYKFGINSDSNTICYNITLYNFRGDYQSPAISATHIHEAAKGKAGPPRIAFPNPEPIGKDVRRSVGCIVGKDGFETGVKNADGVDQGKGFHVKQIEKNPKAFFADVHSSKAVPGAIRGQLS
ncbi:hypothetical protein Q7P37_009254 [Cladosporium fusiforme]